MPKVLVATEKPFAKKAIHGINGIFSKAGYDVQYLESYTEKSALLKAVETVDALIIRSDKIDEEVINHAKELKIIVRAGAGYDNVDLQAATNKDIVVMNTPGQNANAVAELVFGMMISVARNWFNGKPGTELRDKTLGIHAYGNVGRIVAHIAKGFRMDVYAYDPFVDRATMEDEGIGYIESAEELYSKCQYISLHLPYVKATEKMINYDLLKLMPEEACIVNTARKEVIDEEGLLKILGERECFRYASDIRPNCAAEIEQKFEGKYYFTPKKMGAQTREANINAALAASKQIVHFLEKGDCTFQVNK
ncbi:MAG: 3-phosphoglycerate dehydrogenase [Spirochaetes bacterium]|nr:3-phosphoglycerate dehydrogenase [Spirochaetota bacterium]